MASDEHNIEPDNRIRTVNILSRYLDDALRYQRDFGTKEKSVYLWAFIRVGKFYGAYVSLLYIFVKFLYCANVLGQFFLLNRFLETSDYPFFGAHVLWDLLQVSGLVGVVSRSPAPTEPLSGCRLATFG